MYRDSVLRPGHFFMGYYRRELGGSPIRSEFWVPFDSSNSKLPHCLSCPSHLPVAACGEWSLNVTQWNNE